MNQTRIPCAISLVTLPPHPLLTLSRTMMPRYPLLLLPAQLHLPFPYLHHPVSTKASQQWRPTTTHTPLVRPLKASAFPLPRQTQPLLAKCKIRILKNKREPSLPLRPCPFQKLLQSVILHPFLKLSQRQRRPLHQWLSTIHCIQVRPCIFSYYDFYLNFRTVLSSLDNSYHLSPSVSESCVHEYSDHARSSSPATIGH